MQWEQHGYGVRRFPGQAVKVGAVRAGILRGEFGDEDTVVVEAPGGGDAKALTIYRAADNGAGPAVKKKPNPAELVP